MKWIHTSDLHIGKQLNEFSLLEDQRFFLSRLAEFARKEQADALLLSGDLYDRSVPSAEAVTVLNNFLTHMTLECKIPVLAIAGNHDSPQRLDFCSQLLRSSGLFLSGSCQRNLEKIVLKDKWGDVNFYLCPYLEPALVRTFLPEKEIRSYDDAFLAVMEENFPSIDFSARNVILAHGFFSYLKDPGSVARSESEVSIGGSDLIDARILEPFDYAALGHIHRPQATGKDHLCYSGSPLPYSLSEIPFEKSVVVAKLEEKGDLTLRREKLPALRKIRMITGLFDEILHSVPKKDERNDLIFFSLLDKTLVPNAMNRLRAVYPNAIGLRLAQRENVQNLTVPQQKAAKPMDQLFNEFYTAITGDPLEPEQERIVRETCAKVEAGGEPHAPDPS